jgi:creatinine amidohydrolase
MERVPVEPGLPLHRNQIIGAFSGIWWYGDYPEHYAGDVRSATAEKGHKLQALALDGLTRFIKAVKEDTVTPELESEFFEREPKPRE